MPRIHLRINEEMNKQIKKLATKQFKKPTELIKQLIEQGLNSSILRNNEPFDKQATEKEKLLFKVALETLLIGRCLLSSVDESKIQGIIDQANGLTKKYFD